MSEACTKCGFSPGAVEDVDAQVGGDSFDTPPPEAAETGFGPPPEAPAPTDTPAGDKPPLVNLPDQPQEEPKKKQSGVGRGIGIAVAIAAVIAFRAIGNEDEATGPTPDEVEAAMVSKASEQGVTLTADCPDGTEDTAVGDTFECTVTLDDGRTATATVRNREDSYSWKFSRAQ